jgi:hypothetical protein
MVKLRKALLAVLVMVAGIASSMLVATPASAQGTAPCPSYYLLLLRALVLQGLVPELLLDDLRLVQQPALFVG